MTREPLHVGGVVEFASSSDARHEVPHCDHHSDDHGGEDALGDSDLSNV